MIYVFISLKKQDQVISPLKEEAWKLKEEDKTEQNTPERFQKVRNKFDEFERKGIFIREESPSLYIYKKTTTTFQKTLSQLIHTNTPIHKQPKKLQKYLS